MGESMLESEFVVAQNIFTMGRAMDHSSNHFPTILALTTY